MRFPTPFADHYPADAEPACIDETPVPWRFGTHDEYLAIRTGAALFDLTAMGIIEVEGPDAFDFLDHLFARELEFLPPERCTTGLLLDEEAQVVDLVTVYRRDDSSLLVTSPGRVERTVDHLLAHVPDPGRVRRCTDLAILAVEGPDAWGVDDDILSADVASLPFEGVIEHFPWQTDDLLVSRMGYAGEFGFHVIGRSDALVSMWIELCQRIPAVGFEALETAMLEVRQPILHRELTGGASVLACGLNWLVDINKPEFLGREALCRQRESGSGGSTALFRCDDATEPLPAGTQLGTDGTVMGEVVHSVLSPGLGSVIGLARLETRWCSSGLELQAVADGGEVVVTTISSPALVPKSWEAILG